MKNLQNSILSGCASVRNVFSNPTTRKVGDKIKKVTLEHLLLSLAYTTIALKIDQECFDAGELLHKGGGGDFLSLTGVSLFLGTAICLHQSNFIKEPIIPFIMGAVEDPDIENMEYEIV